MTGLLGKLDLPFLTARPTNPEAQAPEFYRLFSFCLFD